MQRSWKMLWKVHVQIRGLTTTVRNLSCFWMKSLSHCAMNVSTPNTLRREVWRVRSSKI